MTDKLKLVLTRTALMVEAWMILAAIKYAKSRLDVPLLRELLPLMVSCTSRMQTLQAMSGAVAAVDDMQVN